MSVLKLFLIAVGLSMDAFGVSICKGLSCQKLTLKRCLIVGLWFGGFQALMPLIGYFLGAQLERYIQAVDHWIAFVLLLLIGVNMIREALGNQDEVDDSLGFQTMLVLALATSIDALAVGVTFAFLQVRILPAVCLIGITTFVISSLGVKIGSVCGERYKKTASIAGGVILILIGTKILLEHLGIF